MLSNYFRRLFSKPRVTQEAVDNAIEYLDALPDLHHLRDILELADEYYGLNGLEAARLRLNILSGSVVVAMGTAALFENIDGSRALICCQIEPDRDDMMALDIDSKEFIEASENVRDLLESTGAKEALWFYYMTPIGDNLDQTFSVYYR
jgi:hypothetical protein